uniref:TGF-beta family profile domain-containing protein n=1 Tax=Cynoglossus semilaevis TaxID=244447 RepID=A0A3P8VH58_CYNSE
MKLWDSLTACLILLSALRASPLPRGAQRPLEPPPVQNRMSVTAGGVSQSESVCRQGGETDSMEGPVPTDYEDMVDLIKVRISRIRHSSVSTVSSSISFSITSSPIRENLSNSKMIFRYCAGPCRTSETNYDKILYTLTHNRKLSSTDTPPQACCRPIAFDDDLSFLDDNLVYHTVKRHSARKCGCVIFFLDFHIHVRPQFISK